MPIFEPGHFTLVYIDVQKKLFSYLNSLGDYIEDTEYFLKIFVEATQLDLKAFQYEHDLQRDVISCGVFVCQFVECLLKGEKLCKLMPPHQYRDVIKSSFNDNSDNMRSVCLHCGLDGDQNMCSSCERPSCSGCFKHYYGGKHSFKCMFCSDKK